MFTLRKKAYPIGVDLGSASLKMVQLTEMEGGLGLVAAAKEDVPSYVQGHATALQEWYVKTVKEMLSDKPFKGRQVVTCLPAREMLVQHLRVAKMGEKELEKALPWEAQGKVPFDIHQALLRHVVACEVYEGDESKLEVILMAASNHVVRQHLQLVERTKVETREISVEPNALVNCFAHLLDQKSEQPAATMFVDLGHHCTKVVVTRGTELAFCRTISIAAEHFRRAISDKLAVNYAAACDLYRQVCQTSAAVQVPDGSASDAVMSDGGAATATLEAETAVDTNQIKAANAAAEPTLQYLCDEIKSCVRYHNLIFPNNMIAKVIFLGGMSKNKGFCQKLARGLGLPAQLGDPLARVLPASRCGKHSDIQNGQSSSDWAVAFGLSLGSYK